MAVVLQLGVLCCSAQINLYLFSGSLTNITLSQGTYTAATALRAAAAYMPAPKASAWEPR